MSNPEISFKYMQNGQTKLHTNGSQNLKELVYHIYGRDISRELIEIDSSSELLRFMVFLQNLRSPGGTGTLKTTMSMEDM